MIEEKQVRALPRDVPDKLVLAVHRNDGQFVQVIDALEQLNNQIYALVSAAHSANGKNTAK